MALELRQQLKLTQQLIMTPQLQMAIKLLQLSRLELMDTIRQELEENPALEEVLETPGEEPLGQAMEEAPAPPTELAPTQEVTIQEKVHDEIDWSGFLEDFSTPSRVTVEREDQEAPKYEAFVTRKESLNDHLLWQFLMTKPPREDEEIASLIIGNLNKDGYLEISVEEIAAAGNVPGREGGDRPAAAADLRPRGRVRARPEGVPADPGEVHRRAEHDRHRHHRRPPAQPREEELQGHLQGAQGDARRGGYGGRRHQGHGTAPGPRVQRRHPPVHHPGHLRLQDGQRLRRSCSTTTACPSCA